MGEWSEEEAKITDPQVLKELRRVLEEESPIIVEHRFYRGARSPKRFIVDDFGEFENYLKEMASPGDSFWIWSFERCCREDDVLARGKKPDSSGRVPSGGVY